MAERNPKKDQGTEDSQFIARNKFAKHTEQKDGPKHAQRGILKQDLNSLANSVCKGIPMRGWQNRIISCLEDNHCDLRLEIVVPDVDLVTIEFCRKVNCFTAQSVFVLKKKSQTQIVKKP